MTATLERELGSGGDLLTSAIARAAALSRAQGRCRAVSAPARAWRRPDGVVAVELRVAPGASLAEVREERPLTVGECVTVGVGVAEALAAMHLEHVAHGDVSPANVLVHGDRVTLVDTMGALCEERGTPGFAAPDRAEGARPASDVFALGMLLRAIADEAAMPIIEAWTAPLIGGDPAARPTAAHAAAALSRCAPRRPVAAPRAPVVAAMRASSVPRTLPTRQDRWWRAERAAVSSTPVVALAVLAGFVGTGLAPDLAEASPWRTDPPSRVAAPAGATVPVSREAANDPVTAAVDLAARRVAALVTGDAVGLRAISAPGSAAARSDEETAAAIEAGEVTFAGLTLDDVSARLERELPGGAIVVVTTALSDYSVGPLHHPAGRATARLRLVLTQKGWQVARILPPA